MSFFFFFFKQKAAYEFVSRDWSSDVCSSDLLSKNNSFRQISASVDDDFDDKQSAVKYVVSYPAKPV